MKHKKLSEYPLASVELTDANITGESHKKRVKATAYKIPAPVADAASNALDYLGDALGNACDGCDYLRGLRVDGDTGETVCMERPYCVIARGYAALHKYQEVSKDEAEKPE